MQRFCSGMDISVVPDAPPYFEDLKDLDSKYADYIASMSYSFPHCEWTGKQWVSNYDETLTLDMVLRSFVIYCKIPLSKVTEARETVSNSIQYYDTLGYEAESFRYISNLWDHGLDKKWITKNTAISRTDVITLLQELKKIDCTFLKSTPTAPTIISNYPVAYEQEYYQDGPIINYMAS